ncbi:hypothetical protein [Cohnella lupini]|uniref:Uncharacterized protein n=1 Tax=Cohnella lupini TaxID=1294267 RepID=A0A3D9HU86_9BACL|nr:hypothetical protein [Cohnella lupini]RED52990.1 hypothetical protein DFP95_12849 [Cohnella lupini]
MKLNETIADISIVAGALMTSRKIEVDDSRELVARVIEWTEQFEREHSESYWDEGLDYMTEIEVFAEAKLVEAYGAVDPFRCPACGGENVATFLHDRRQCCLSCGERFELPAEEAEQFN